MARASGSGSGSDFSVLVLGSDFATDAGAALLTHADRDEWHDCVPDLGDDFTDLEELQVVRVQGTDRAGRTVVRVVGKFFPAPVIDGERLKRYVFFKFHTELPEGPFCILYMHTTVQSDDNNPGMSILRTIYEELPPEYKERLQVFYFLHPGLRSRLAIATLGRLFLSGGLYWKIKYVSRLEYLWGDIRKGEVEIPDFVIEHDQVLEHRPLTDYGIEPDPLHLADVPAMGYSLGRYEDKWSPEDRFYSRNYMLYWKIKYVSRLEYLWGDIRKGEVEIPDFVIEHDQVLEHRPLTDYGIEPDPLHLADVPAMGYSLGRYEDKWSPGDRFYSRNYM